MDGLRQHEDGESNVGKETRAVLDALKRESLHRIADAEKIELADRRALDSMRETLGRSSALTLETILGHLSRDELKTVCQALGLDDSGREKEELRERILSAKGRVVSVSDSALGASDPPRRNGPRTTEEPAATPSPDGKLTLQALEAHLWASADILRGSIDAADFKNYIFGLLFLKRVSDVFEEEAEKLERAGKQKKFAWEDPDQHRFFVPERARWSSLAKLTTNVGEAIDKAVGALEDANHELEGVFGGISFNDKDRLPDTMLVALVRHFSRMSLRNADLSDPDILGRAYEYLIAQFASTAGKKGGEFYTPKEVVRLLVEILRPEERMRVYDPCCGSGGMLIQAARYLKEHGKNPKKLSLFGQERNVGTWAICKMNLFLHDLEADIQKGDTLRTPRHTEGGALKVFDRVIANPPFSLDAWGREECEADPFGRFRYGLPAKSYGDLAFVQHMLASANDRGMVGTVMPHGVLFRGGAEQEIRAGFVKEDRIEAVVGLSDKLFYGTGIPACLLILNRNKPTNRRGKVLFLYGTNERIEGKNQNALGSEHVAKLAKAFHDYADVEKFSRVVPNEEIAKNDFNLNITRYVDVAEAGEEIDVAAELRKLRELEKQRAEAEKVMYGLLAELGYGE
jgi:type I restriction enzyme M protein